MPQVVEADVGLQFQAYDVEAEPDEDEEGGESAEDADDDAGIAEAERDPDPAAGARPQLPLIVLFGDVFAKLLQGLEGILAEGLKVLIDPLPVGEDPILLIFVSHNRISEEPRSQMNPLIN